MESLLNIIRYIYKRKGKKLDIESMDDFDEGIYFPQFISLIFDEKVKKLKKKLESPADFLNNFRATLTFIRNKKIIVKNFTRLPTPEEKEKILLTIITKAYFTMNTDDILEKLKPILESQDLEGEYENVHKIFSGKFLLTLLSILTDGKISMPNAVQEPDFEEDVIESLKKVKVPIAIDSNSFEKDDMRFLIQIQIIFVIFSDKIDEIKSVKVGFMNKGRLHALRKKIKKAITGNIKLLEPLDDDDTNEVNKSDEIILKKDYYQEDNAILNIVNSLIKDNSQKIDFLSAIFTENVDSLFKLVQDVTGIATKITNIDEMLDFLRGRFPENKSFFVKFSKPCKTQYVEFIKNLLNCSYFTSEKIELLRSRCQAIYHEFQINFTDFDEFYESKGLLFLPLLQKVAFNKYSDIDFASFPPEKELTFTKLHEYFDQLNIPFVLDINSLSRYQDIEKFIINYQTKLIIDQFDIAYLNKIEANNSVNDESLSPLLKTINMIGSRKGLHFHSLESVIDGCLLPCFVECLLQKPLREKLNINKSQQLTKAQSDKNIEIIIQYLKTQKDKFNILLFNFNDSEMKLKSAKKLCKNLINLFFIKTSRKEILERCDSIIGYKYPIKSIEDFKEGKVFFVLLHFITKFNIKFAEMNLEKLNYKRLKDKFEEANVTMIINENVFSKPTSDEDAIFYQLQIIFNKLDDEIHRIKPGIAVIEIFLQAAKILSKVNILEYHILKISSEAKTKSQDDRKPRIFKSEKKEITKTQDNKIPTYHIDELKKLKEKEERRMNCFDNVLNTEKDTLGYWNPFDDEYKVISKIKLQNFFNYKDNLLSASSTVKTHSYTPNYFKLLSNELKSYFKNEDSFKHKKKEAKKQGRLYKFYIYDEELKKWVFNNDEFEQYIKDSKIGYKESKFAYTATNLILIFNSNEEDLSAIKSNYFEDSSNDDDNQLFIYSLSYKYEDDYFKPTFLFLHVPQKNIDNLAFAIIQIYIYLYAISDVQILLLNLKSESNNDKIHKQIEMIKIIDKISKKSNIKTNAQSKIVFLANYSVPSYEKRFCNNLQNGKFAQEIKEIKMNIIPFGFDSDNNVFQEIINDITDGHHHNIGNLLIKLQNNPEYEISGLYLRIITQPLSKQDEVMKGIIKERIGYFDKSKDPTKDAYLSLLDEFAFFTPQNDMEFNQKYRYIIYQILSQIPDKKKKELKLLENELYTELDNFSKKMMLGFKNFIISELFWEDQQVSILLNSYSMLLEKAFYYIIFTTGYGRIADIVYTEYSEILRKQKIRDSQNIKKYFENFDLKIIRRSEEKDLQNELIKSTKYIMKETENLKDREVLVNAGQNLEDVIDQDF